jgi:hypothetical protein
VYSQNLPVFNFVNWHRYPNHELRLRDLALELGFSHVSMSSEVMPMIRAVPRGFTTAADAYLTPLIRDYLSVNEAIQWQDEVFNYTIIQLTQNLISGLLIRVHKPWRFTGFVYEKRWRIDSNGRVSLPFFTFY